MKILESCLGGKFFSCKFSLQSAIVCGVEIAQQVDNVVMTFIRLISRVYALPIRHIED